MRSVPRISVREEEFIPHPKFGQVPIGEFFLYYEDHPTNPGWRLCIKVGSSTARRAETVLNCFLVKEDVGVRIPKSIDIVWSW